MAKVTVHHDAKPETPTQAIVKSANAVQTVTDERGRVLAIKKMKPLDRLKMFEVVGAENSKNEMYLGYASLAYHVASIDGEAVNRPATKMQLEALVQRLDDDGLNAVGQWLEEQAKANQEIDVETIKNG
jgi:hypothetical protein